MQINFFPRLQTLRFDVWQQKIENHSILHAPLKYGLLCTVPFLSHGVKLESKSCCYTFLSLSVSNIDLWLVLPGASYAIVLEKVTGLNLFGIIPLVENYGIYVQI